MRSELDCDDCGLRERIRELLASADLPQTEPVSMWGGAGHGAQCSICARPILCEEIAFDLLFRMPGGDIELHLHRHCHAAWDLLRRGF